MTTEEFKAHRREYERKYWAEHPELRKKSVAYHKKRRKNPNQKLLHNIRSKQYMNKYKNTLNGKAAIRKRNSRRLRELGYNLLNMLFNDCNGHHIDKVNVINIPEQLHKSILHRQSNNDQMKQINILAWSFMESSSY